VPSYLLAASWVLLGAAIAKNNGAYTRPALAAAVAAELMLGAAVVLSSRLAHRRTGEAGSLTSGPARPQSDRESMSALGVMLGAGAAGAVAWEPAIYGSGTALWWARGLAALSAVAALGLLVGSTASRVRAAATTLVAGLLGGVLLLRASPAPFIDVWVILQQAADSVVRGDNIYSQCWVGNTDRLTDCLYPYLPATTLLQLPAKLLLDDVRYALLAALLAAAAIVCALASTPPVGSAWRWRTVAATGGAAGALVLVQPKWLFLLEQSWTEPLIFVLLAGMVLAVTTGHGWWAVVLLGLALASKQHVVLLLPLAAAWPAFGLRRTAYAVGVAGLVVLPWFLAGPGEMVADVIDFHVALPARPDSLSLNSAALELGWELPLWLAAVVTLIALGLALRLERDACGFALGSALVLLTFNLMNKQVFFNHHTLVLQMTALAVALRLGASSRDTPVAATERSPATRGRTPGAPPSAATERPGVH
jgi:hypothetical protein